MLHISTAFRDALTEYFWLGFPYADILQLLSTYHNVHMSRSSLLRRLKDLRLTGVVVREFQYQHCIRSEHSDHC